MADSINSTLVVSLTTFTFQMNRYLSIYIILFGTIGNVLNLLIFYQPKHRSNPCAIYFFYASIAGLIALYSGLISRIFAGFGLDLSATPNGLCQSPAFIVQVSTKNFILVFDLCACRSILYQLSRCESSKYE
jgi:hypothetical protein